MKTMWKKVLSLCLALILVAGLLPGLSPSAQAGYNHNYQLTGNSAVDIGTVGAAQKGRNGPALGYNSAWCDAFVIDCASIIGESAAIPAVYGVGALRQAVIDAGGVPVSDPQAGDLVFYCEDYWFHVGIMLDSYYSIQGNVSNLVQRIPYNQLMLSYDESTNTGTYPRYREFIRPNYRKNGHTHNLSNFVCPDDNYFEPLTETAIDADKQCYRATQVASVYPAPYTTASAAATVGVNTPLVCTATVTNKQNETWYKLGGNYNGKWIKTSDAEYHPKSDLAMFMRIETNPMLEGRTNSVLGNIKSSYYAMDITGILDGKTYCTFTTDKGSLLLHDSDVSKRLPFDDLEPGEHTLQVRVVDQSGKEAEKTAKFTVTPAVAKPRIEDIRSVGSDPSTKEPGGKQIALSCATGGATLYYTLDGTDPTPQSTQYTLPFKVENTCILKVRGFKEDKCSAILEYTITVKQAQTPVIASEDIPDGTRVTITAEDNAIIYYMVKGSSTFRRYLKPILFTQPTEVTAYAQRSGCRESAHITANIAVNPPAKPEFISPANNEKFAQNSAAVVKWNSIPNASGYTVKVLLNGVEEDTLTTKDANASISLSKPGTYTVTVSAHNVIGESKYSEPLNLISVAPVTVSFEDWDGSVISRQVVEFGGDAVKPVDDPARKGHFFLYWDGKWTGVQEDTTIQAIYRICSYNVFFYDQNNNLLGPKQVIEYGGEADIPTFTPDDIPTGYAFLGWSIQADDPESACDLTHIDSNMTVKAVVDWKNSELPLDVTVTSATRDDSAYIEGDDQSGGNYIVTVQVNNYPKAHTTAMLRVSLKTAEDKMVKSEVRTVSLKPGESDTYEFTLNYSGTATCAEAVALGYNGDYRTGSALSEAATAQVQVQSGIIFGFWTDWSDDVPSAKDGRLIESKTVYRYKTTQTKVSTARILIGWSAKSSEWRETGSGTHDYFIRPSGFKDGELPEYATAALSSYETATTKRIVSDPTFLTYIYWRWSFPCNAGKGSNTNTLIGLYEGEYEDKYGDWATVWEAFVSNSNASLCPGTTDAYVYANRNSTYGNNWLRTNAYRQTYTDYTKYTTFTRTSAWSDWQDAAPIQSGDATYEIETKTVYRYKDKDVPVLEDIDTSLEDRSGQFYTFSGALEVDPSVDLEGKLATVMVYKGKNADPNESQLQYVGQTSILSGNRYNIRFKTKDEPTIESGDYIVSLGVQGALGLVNIDMIKAPVPEYTVRFYSDETLVDTQTVPEGGSVTLPEAPEKDGYKFVVWSETGRNVHGDLNISAVYTPVTYAVVFVD